MNSTLVKLGEFDILEVSGEENKTFLQGQISCNTELLTPNQSLRGALCNIKGRVITDFRLVEHLNHCFLQFAAGMGQVAREVLEKYIVFSKAETRLCSDRFNRYGLIGNDAHSLLQELAGDYPFDEDAVTSSQGCLLIKIPGLIPRYEIWQDLEAPDSGELIVALENRVATSDITPWLLEDMNSGIAHISPVMSEHYLPEALNYDVAGVIDFKKGCYTGQEIIARMYYRGVAKKRLYHLTMDNCPLALDDIVAITDEHDLQTVSDEMINKLISDSGACHLLAILPVESVSNETGFCLNNQPDLPLQIRSFPYQPGKVKQSN